MFKKKILIKKRCYADILGLTEKGLQCRQIYHNSLFKLFPVIVVTTFEIKTLLLIHGIY